MRVDMLLRGLCGGLLAGLLLPGAAMADLSAAQARYDRNGDGALSREEAPPAVLRYFTETDADKSGGLTAEELDGLALHLTAERQGTPDPALRTWLETQPAGFASIDAYMRRLVDELPLEGAGIFVCKAGRTIHQETFGIYDPQTVIPIASASKWLTAATIMTLVDEGLLDLDTPISAYWDEATGEAGRMTLRQMLSHTAGTGGSHLADQPRDFTLEDSARGALALPRSGPPGERFQYGGVSMQIAGYIAERVSGKPWAELFEERIAGPLGMERTWYGFAQKPEPRESVTNPILAAGVYSCLEDYAPFLLMLAADGVHDGKRVLSAAAVDEMMRDYADGGAGLGQRTSASDPRGYGLGSWCDEMTPDGACPVAQSGGAFGVSPRIDRRTDSVILLMTKDRMPMMRPYWGAIIAASEKLLASE